MAACVVCVYVCVWFVSGGVGGGFFFWGGRGGGQQGLYLCIFPRNSDCFLGTLRQLLPENEMR